MTLNQFIGFSSLILVQTLWAATELDISKGNIEIKAGGEYVITGTTSQYNITVDATSPVQIILRNVKVNLTGTNLAAFTATSEGLTVLLDGIDSLVSGKGSAITSTKVFVLDDYVAPSKDDGKVGSLYAKGGGDQGGAGFGNVTIKGGKIHAQGTNAAGIGGVTMEGGDVMAYGGSFAPGVSGLKMLGGKLNAYGGSYAAGIGGYKGMSSGLIEIHGGKIYAVSGGYAAAIGAGQGAAGSHIIITGGFISMSGATRYYSMGGGQNTSVITANVNSLPAGLVEISGGTIVCGQLYCIGAATKNNQQGVLTITGGSIHSDKGSISVLSPRSDGTNPIYRLLIKGVAQGATLDSLYFSSQPKYLFKDMKSVGGSIVAYLPAGPLQGSLWISGIEYPFSGVVGTEDLDSLSIGEAVKIEFDGNPEEYEQMKGKFVWKKGDTVVPLSESFSATLSLGEWSLYEGETFRHTFLAQDLGWAATTGSNYKLVRFATRPNFSVPSQQVYYGEYAKEPLVQNEGTCKFEGWYTDSTFAKKWDFAATPITKVVKIMGKFSKECPGVVTPILDRPRVRPSATLGHGDVHFWDLLGRQRL